MTVLILGCGWIGEAFAKELQAAGHTVYASTTNMQKYHRLQADGISVILADFDQAGELTDFPERVDYVLNSVPASKSLKLPELTLRYQRIATLLDKLSYKKHIFLSSIGVYPDKDGYFSESSAVLADSNLRRAELQMLACRGSYVYRLGGLFGRDRIFAKYFKGRICTSGAQAANFIHSDDVLGLLQEGFQQELKTNLYNAVCPMHPSKEEVVVASATKYGLELPTAFVAQDSFQKVVSGAMLAADLNYAFKFPSPLDF